MNSSILRKGKFLEYATLGWNIIGVLIIIRAVRNIHSIALIGFGFDTLLEIGASIIVIWELNGIGGKRQKLGLRSLSIAFFALGIYILTQSILNLIYHTFPGQSLLGIEWLLLTIVVMIILAFKKFQIGKLLNNPVLLTEGRVTLVDACLAFIVLLSMLFTTLLGWWWFDSIGGLILMGYCFWEAIHIWYQLRRKKEYNYTAPVEMKTSLTSGEEIFILEQAENKLKEIISAGDVVVSRSTTIITLIVGIILGLISYSINRYQTICSIDDLIGSSICGSIYLFIVIWDVSRNLKGKDYAVLGSDPRISEKLFNLNSNEIGRQKRRIWAQIETYQDRIDLNNDVNSLKWKRFNRSIFLVILSPIVLLAAFYIIGYLRSHNWL